jgi:hypothetical protein
MYWKEKYTYKFLIEISAGREILRIIGVERRIILKRILNTGA